MINEFGRTLSLLRKQRNLSQKQVAEDLGVSQALLSHYEKGKRECSLSFLVKTAEYFDVTTDYLLGITTSPDNNNSSNNFVQLLQPDDTGNSVTNTYYLINRKLIINTVTILYNILSEIDSKKLNKYVSDYLMTSLYSVFRKIAYFNKNNAYEFFNIKNSAENYCNASMNLDLAKIDKLNTEQIDKMKIDLSAENISNKNREIFGSLTNLIRSVEKNINSKFKI